jgi:hypothetical protein
MTEEGMTSPHPPDGLVEKFCTICDIKDRKTHMLFEAILGRADVADVRRMLHDEEYDPEDDDEDKPEKTNNDTSSASRGWTR